MSANPSPNGATSTCVFLHAPFLTSALSPRCAESGFHGDPVLRQKKEAKRELGRELQRKTEGKREREREREREIERMIMTEANEQ